MAVSSPVQIGPQLDLFGIANTIAEVSGPVMLVLALVALWRGWVVFPREIEVRDRRIADLRQERDEFKELTLAALKQAERVATTAEERSR